MDFTLSDEQRLLQDSAQRLVERDYPFDRRRKIAASEDGFSRQVWAQFAELGWLALPLPEAHGGLGGSPFDVAVLMEALGRGLVLEPYLASVVFGGGLVAAGASEARRAEILPKLAEGGLMLAVGYAERQSRFNLADVETRAEALAAGGGYVLSGHKGVVFNGAAADRIVVSARTAGSPRERGGITLFLVDPKAAGVTLRPYRTQDALCAAELGLDGVAVAAEDVVGEIGGGLALLEAAVDRAITAIAAEAVGIMEAMLGQTQEFMKTRKQFGVPIGSFQVLQHHMVDMFTAHQTTKAMAYRAAASIDAGDAAARARTASAVKVQVGRAGKLIGQLAIQLHGGMGMTDELAIGHYFKRLAMIEPLFGNADHHLKRFAGLG
jgi:alkylation response protein AidB-like acyl-CoA dehydrogenase